MRAWFKMLVVTGLGLGLTSCVRVRSAAKTLVPASPNNVASRTVQGIDEVGQCSKLGAEPAVKEEYALGSALSIHFVQGGGGLLLRNKTDEQVHLYLNTVGRNLASQSLRPTLSWTFGVLNDPESLNAVSAPGGYVLVSRKLLEQVDNEGQLAGVLAHEIAHVVLKHSLHQYAKVKVGLCKSAAVSGIVSSRLKQSFEAASMSDGSLDLDADTGLMEYLVKASLKIIMAGNNQNQEFEADEMAVQLMLSAGYDPEQYIVLLGKTGKSGGGISKHPKSKARQDRIEKYLKALSEAQPPGSFVELEPPADPKSPELPASFATLKTPDAKSTGVAKDAK
ncbi:M48 family metallopeptidase [Corallococcus sp. bb12-1]|uniref:M48 family metallopeptidase n=1 Tax=Corallococcus sp. bb12-1 TaxID=2996784 RepID=UPI002270F5ED|nr:M48 family metallopeptidase [Corallococcus sp. bb12-1]MCY1046500.1 M48 family metallopeptidase [Corallococcus sp. bb12-1]